MTAAAPTALTDRSELRHVLVQGAKLGVLTAVTVVVYLLAHRFLSGTAAQVIESLIVIAGLWFVCLLPAHWTAARHTEGIAGAAGLTLWSAVVFSIIDIIVLRPLHAYPWTWDAVGGGSTWWYLPTWWQAGTFLGWMGALLTAGRASRGASTGPAALGIPVLILGIVLGVVILLLKWTALWPVAFGFGWSVAITVLGVAAIARKAPAAGD